MIFDQGVRDRVKAIEFYDSIHLVVHGNTIEELAESINVPGLLLNKLSIRGIKLLKSMMIQSLTVLLGWLA